MKIAIFGRITDNTDLDNLVDFLEFLQQEGIFYLVYHDYAAELKEVLRKWDTLVGPYVFKAKRALHNCDYAYSFGGDGTFLTTAAFVGTSQVPLLGVNFGRLGFLTTIMSSEIKNATLDLAKDIYKIENRTMITVESNPKGLFRGLNFGMNDLTIHKNRSNEMITVHTYINGEFLNSYWGDGLIISTATGSTAYSLSCGGPIIHPKSNAFVITPVAPHSLTVRPMVIPNSFVVSFEIESRSGHAMISLDNRTELVNKKVEIAIKKADFEFKLVRMASGNYLDNLRNRLMWGKDRRN